MSIALQSNPASERSVRHDPLTAHTRIVRGRDEILALQQMLSRLSLRSGQPGAMDDLEYHLSRPAFVGKRPTLVLIFGAATKGGTSTTEDPDGAVLLYEYQVAGVGCRLFAADYHGGDRTVISTEEERCRTALQASAALLRQGALVVQLSYEGMQLPLETAVHGIAAPGRHVRWSASLRPMTGYLPIEVTVDATLAKLGKHTRRNLRYYRRRAEAELGHSVVEHPQMTRREFVAFNSMCAYPASSQEAGWRYEAVERMAAGSLYLGLRSASGEWLSLIGGRTHQGGTTIEWQMNRADMPSASLSTVMRSHLIEHEVARGTSRLYFVAGTSHSIRGAMIPDNFVDLIVSRWRIPKWLGRRLAGRDQQQPNFLGQMLSSTTVSWHAW